MNMTPSVIGIALILGAGLAFAHDDAHKKKAPLSTAQRAETSFGRTGDAKKFTRTVTITMSDKMRYTPDTLTVKRGETIQFVVKNSGKFMHELVLGNLKELKEHAELMRKFPDMEHDEPYMAHVAPGKSATIVWQFTQAGEFYFGCLIPGHFESGMAGKIRVSL